MNKVLKIYEKSTKLFNKVRVMSNFYSRQLYIPRSPGSTTLVTLFIVGLTNFPAFGTSRRCGRNWYYR